MNLGRLIARIVVGGFFVGHGLQKWLGWFGGPGLDGATGMMESLEMRPARVNAHLASGIEAVGGAMVVAGAFTPLAAAGLIATMITAIRKVHLANGPWNSDQGYEYNLVLIAGAARARRRPVPGGLSVDAARGRHETGAGWALAALAAGAAGSTAAIEAGARG